MKSRRRARPPEGPASRGPRPGENGETPAGAATRTCISPRPGSDGVPGEWGVRQTGGLPLGGER